MKRAILIAASLLMYASASAQTTVSIDTSMFANDNNTKKHEAKWLSLSIENGEPVKVFRRGRVVNYVDLSFYGTINNKYTVYFNKRDDGSYYLNTITPTAKLKDFLEYLAGEYVRLINENNQLRTTIRKQQNQSIQFADITKLVEKN